MDTLVPSPLSLRLLGGFELHGADGTDLSPPGKKLRALVALLALAPPAGWPRERLTALLWGDRDEEQARGSLRQALAELRRTLGEAVLLADREIVAFDPAILRTDAVEFARLAAAGQLTEAASLYRHDLLDGVALPDSAFNDWLVVERTRLHDMAIGVLARLLADQSGEDAIATAQRLLRLDPANERAHQALMRLYAARGDRAQALRQYQICRDALRRELDIVPAPQTEQLHREIHTSRPGGGAAQPMAAEAHRNDIPARAQPSMRWRLASAVALLLLVAAGLGWLHPWRGLSSEQSTSRPDKPLVAVLPFVNLSGEPQQQTFADGLTEDIIIDLGRFPEFQVIAYNSTRAYKDKLVDPRAAGKALGAGFVVTGSIQRESNRVRITAQLIETATGASLWSQRWDRPDQDFFAIQSEISDQVSNRMGGGAGLIQEAGRIAAHRKPPSSLTAYEFYLLGTEKLEQVNQTDVEEAIRLLTKAVELDPGLARAWIELFHCHDVLAGFDGKIIEHRTAAEQAARRAVELDPSDAEAHAVLAMSFGDHGDFVRAKAEFDLAMRLAPGAAEIMVFYIGWASTFGEPERGAAMIDQVIRLNPDYPMWTNRPFSYAYFMAGRYEEALRMMDRIPRESYSQWLWSMRPGALAALGRKEEAAAAVKEALATFPDLTIESVANWPGFNELEYKRLIDTMRLAAFPPCAKPEYLAQFAKPTRLPECE